MVASARPEVEQQVYKLLAAGKQSDAEELLSQQIGKFPQAVKFSQLIAGGEKREAAEYLEEHTKEIQEAQRIYFLIGATIRSRFNKQAAFVIFRSVYAMNPDTPSGKCALCMMRLDTERGAWSDEKKNRSSLQRASSAGQRLPQRRDDALDAGRRVSHVQPQRRRLRHVSPGPEKMETRSGAGPSNLRQLARRVGTAQRRAGRALQSGEAGARLLELRWFGKHAHPPGPPQGSPQGLSDGGRERRPKRDRGAPRRTGVHAAADFDEAIERCQRTAEADPKNWRAWWMWGQALEKQGKLDEALEKYQEALALEPNSDFLQELVNKLEAKLAKP